MSYDHVCRDICVLFQWHFALVEKNKYKVTTTK